MNGDVTAAKRAISAMDRLKNGGIDNDDDDDDDDDNHSSPDNRGDSNSNDSGGDSSGNAVGLKERLLRNGVNSVIRKGNKYILRKTKYSKVVEIGR